MLNDNLRDQVIVHLNGRMLKKTKIFGDFDFRFLSEVTFLLENDTFAMDDHIFEEGDNTNKKMFFITKVYIKGLLSSCRGYHILT